MKEEVEKELKVLASLKEARQTARKTLVLQTRGCFSLLPIPQQSLEFKAAKEDQDKLQKTDSLVKTYQLEIDAMKDYSTKVRFVLLVRFLYKANSVKDF